MTKKNNSLAIKTNSPQLRLRVFAGPNGSGKSTVIDSVRNAQSNNHPIDFGAYINADEITRSLKNGKFSFAQFKIKLNKETFTKFASDSGLLGDSFSVANFEMCHEIKGNTIHLVESAFAENLGQVIARFLREEMLRLRRRFSFETVFSHISNVEIMEAAVEAGYKVYLYFVSTESPAINKYRVELRVKKGGHDVPPDKIEKRYKNSLNLMYDAAQLAYQAYFFDNSIDGQPFKLIAHFKKSGKKKKWDNIPRKDVSNWFKVYYTLKNKKLTKINKGY